MKARAEDHTAAVSEVARISTQACQTTVCTQLTHSPLG